MENYIPISFLNDFTFCPRSIYFHQLYGNFDSRLYQKKPQIAGTAAHSSIDNGNYSTASYILKAYEVYSEKYQIFGKIDLFNTKTGLLTERKKKIVRIYDGYIFQIYAHYHALREMGYTISNLQLYSLDDNKKYPILKPEENQQLQNKFETLIEKIHSFRLEAPFTPQPNKCAKCIYANLCDKNPLC